MLVPDAPRDRLAWQLAEVDDVTVLLDAASANLEAASASHRADGEDENVLESAIGDAPRSGAVASGWLHRPFDAARKR